MTLSLKSIEAARPGDILRDDTVKGLHLRVTSKKKAFYIYYLTKTKVERRPRIGDYPTITLAAARRIATEILTEVAAGRDPGGELKSENAAPTVSDLCDLYIERHIGTKKTGAGDVPYIEKTIRPKLGKLKVAAVRMVDVQGVFLGMRSKPIAANRMLAIVSKMFNLAEAWELRIQGTNPCRHISKNRENKRKRYMTREESGAVVERLRFYTPRQPEAAAFLWLLIYTGARPSEIAALRAEDRKGSVLTLTEHKTSAKTQTVRTIHLPPQAVAILDGLPTGGETLLGIASPKSLWLKIMKDTRITNLNIYDLRHTFASVGVSSGLSLSAIGELMGHSNTSTTQRYAHLIDESARAAVTLTADAFDAFSRPNLKVVK